MTDPLDDGGVGPLLEDGDGPDRTAGSLGGAGGFNPLVIGSGLVLLVAGWMGLQSWVAPDPGPAASPRPSGPGSMAPSAAAITAQPSARAKPSPRFETPQHLALSGRAGFFIGDMWVSLELPPSTEGDYYPSEVLDANSPFGGITVTSARTFSSNCLDLATPSPEAGTPTTSPSSDVPGVGAASGSTFVLDGHVGRYLEFTQASASCHPNLVWDLLAPEIGGRGIDVRLQLWILDMTDQHLVLGRYTPIDEDPEALEGTRKIVASVRVEAGEAAFDAGHLPAGPVGPGWYWVLADNRTDQSGPDFVPLDFVLHVPDGGWTASGSVEAATGWQLEHGTPGTRGGAIVRIGRVDGVYSDPCSHEQAPPVDASASGLADAVAAIPGIEVTERLATYAHGDTFEHVALTIPRELPCSPGDFWLWYDDVEGPRAATAIGSIIRLWIFTPNDRSVFGRLVIEAETYAGENPTLKSDVLQMLYSIQHGG